MKPQAWIAAFGLIGLLAGGSLRLATGGPPVYEIRPDPNPVIANVDGCITLDHPSLTLNRLAAEYGRQTGRKFVLAGPYRADKTQYAALLAETPLNRVLDATAYVSGGRWERTGNTYTLRVPTKHEKLIDPVQHGGALQRLDQYLEPIDINDASLPEAVRPVLKNLRDAMRRTEERAAWISPLPEQGMGVWQVGTDEGGIEVDYQELIRFGNMDYGHWGHMGWGAGHE